MNWFFLAVIGHASNAIAFVIDKTLLNTAFKRSTTYAALIGGISLAALILLPWTHRALPIGVYPFVIGFGALFVFALVAFFEALKRAEASRVIPIVGSLIPLVTFAGSFFLGRETMSSRELIGFFLLIAATVFLTAGGRAKRRMTLTVFGFSILAAVLFAVASLCGKYAFDQADIAAVFIWSRVAAAVTGILLGLFVSGSRHELSLIFRGGGGQSKRSAAGLAVFGQLCGGFGFILVNLALAGGSASKVNALQAVQYALIILAAWIGGTRLRKLLNEEMSSRMIIQKMVALVFVALGLSLIA